MRATYRLQLHHDFGFREAVATGSLSAERFAAYQKLAAELAEIAARQVERSRTSGRKPIRTPTKRR